jgi:hypothetical protein
MDVDGTQSLAQLTKTDWGIAPQDVGSLIRERYEFRRTPLKSLSFRALMRLLSLDFQDDCNYLVPYCLNRITTEPPVGVEELSLHCNLLLAVLPSEKFDWLQSPDLVRRARRQVKAACNALDRLSDEAEQTDDSLEYYKVLLPNTQMQATLYEALALFEQRLSRVEPGSPQNGGTATQPGNVDVTDGPPSMS